MDLDSALSAHGEWKTKFRVAIGKKDKLDAQSVGRDDCCPLGKWLHGDAKAAHGGKPAYQKVLSAHANFHTEAGKVAAKINDGKYAEAEAMLGAGTGYSNASQNAAVAIIGLKSAL